MKYIHTTASAVEKLKTRAKFLKRTENISHSEALLRAAKESGYDDWHHVVKCQDESKHSIHSDQSANALDPITDRAAAYMQFLSRVGTAEVKQLPLPSKGNIFHAVEIEGVRFRCGITIGGPYIEKMVNRYDSDGDVVFGVSSIHLTNKNRFNQPTPPDWWVCKYGPRESRFYIGMLSEAGLYAFAREFGLVINPPSDSAAGGLIDIPKEALYNANEREMFYLSPAFLALKRWALKHPRKAKEFSQISHYLFDWLERATKEDCEADNV